MDLDSALNVKTAHFNEVTCVGAVTGDELSNDCYRLGGVNLEIRSGTVVSFVAHAERSEIASVLVTLSLVSLNVKFPVYRVTFCFTFRLIDLITCHQKRYLRTQLRSTAVVHWLSKDES